MHDFPFPQQSRSRKEKPRNEIKSKLYRDKNLTIYNITFFTKIEINPTKMEAIQGFVDGKYQFWFVEDERFRESSQERDRENHFRERPIISG